MAVIPMFTRSESGSVDHRATVDAGEQPLEIAAALMLDHARSVAAAGGSFISADYAAELLVMWKEETGAMVEMALLHMNLCRR